jgi:hypothetical protein
MTALLHEVWVVLILLTAFGRRLKGIDFWTCESLRLYGYQVQTFTIMYALFCLYSASEICLVLDIVCAR